MSEKDKSGFRQAVPVWLTGREREINCCAELECDLRDAPAKRTLRLTGASFYQVFVDGKLFHFGPARKAHGFAGVDVLSVPENAERLTICIMGYYCPCCNGALRSSFVQAELECGGTIFAATGFEGFTYYEKTQHLQKVVRYSRQRQFTECWDFTRERKEEPFSAASPDAVLIGREVPYADYTEFFAQPESATGTWRLAEENQLPLRYFAEQYPYAVFSQDEWESSAYSEYLRLVCDYSGGKPEVFRMERGECRRWDFGEVQAGFFRLKLRTYGRTRILLSFDERLDGRGRPYAEEFNVINLIEWILPEGEWDLYSFEPYTARYAEILVMEGAAEVKALSMLEFAYPAEGIRAAAPADPELALIHRAAERTFRHNVLDIYMDCPSRERAGWLFDSFYTGKAEWFFTGKSTVEKAFLKNYAAGAEMKERPGMVNMLYPGDLGPVGKFIPQWAMWYALEICDYAANRGGMQEKELFRQPMEKLCRYFEGWENEFGLLERMDGFNFVEWSEVNNRVWDVSWATNMLYTEMLHGLGALYDRDDWLQKSGKLRRVILEMAFDGCLFRDRAVRNADGKLVNTEELSEVTQYYALRFHIADIDSPDYAYLRRMAVEVFGPKRGEEYPEIVKADLLPGVFLRIELLLEWKMPQLLLEEIKEYFLPMAKESGTLWEHCSGYKSRDHAFASFAAAAIAQALQQ